MIKGNSRVIFFEGEATEATHASKASDPSKTSEPSEERHLGCKLHITQTEHIDKHKLKNLNVNTQSTTFDAHLFIFSAVHFRSKIKSIIYMFL